VVNNFKRDNFPLGKKCKFATEFELKIQEAKQFEIWFEFKRYLNLLEKSHKFTKIFIDMIFNTVNFGWFTCIENLKFLYKW
jgi:hypothetical protein